MTNLEKKRIVMETISLLRKKGLIKEEKKVLPTPNKSKYGNKTLYETVKLLSEKRKLNEIHDTVLALAMTVLPAGVALGEDFVKAVWKYKKENPKVSLKDAIKTVYKNGGIMQGQKFTWGNSFKDKKKK